MVRKKKPALRSVGHGKLKSRKLSKGQLQAIKSTGHTYIKIGGQRKRVTPGNVRKGAVYYYKRSDTRKYVLRNFKRDRRIKATRRAIRSRGYSGD